MKPYVVTTAPDTVEDVAAEILNSFDCASIVFKSWVSITMLTRKPEPVGHPSLGGRRVVFPRSPSTSAARTWLFAGPSF
jgi:hypothetical protein